MVERRRRLSIIAQPCSVCAYVVQGKGVRRSDGEMRRANHNGDRLDASEAVNRP
jgi:hypothetical protein